MHRTLKRNVAIGAAGLAAVAGAGAAYGAASGSTDHRAAFLKDAAKRLDVTPDKLTAALQAAAGDQLDQAVKDGKLTQAQADRMKARLKADGGLPFGPGPGGPGERGVLRFGGPGGPPGLDAAAKYLGLTADKLHTQLDAGKSLADVAKAQGKALDGLKTALLGEAQTRLDQAVKDGKLTATQRDKLLAGLKAHVDELLSAKGHGGHFGGPGGPGGPGPFGGPPHRRGDWN